MRARDAGRRGVTRGGVIRRSGALASACVLVALGCSAAEEPGAGARPVADPRDDPTPARTQGTRGDAGSSAARGLVLVLGPRALDEPKLPPSVSPSVPEITPPDRHALAYQFNAPIYRRPDARAIRGFARRGRRLPVARWLRGEGCARGWLELGTGGFVCNDFGFNTSSSPPDLPEDLRTRPPADRPLPFAYARVRRAGLPLWTDLPTGDEIAPAAHSEGVTFVAIDRETTREDGEVFVRDVRGRYLRKADVVPAPAQTLRGDTLGEGGAELPLAFVHEPQVPVLASDGASARGLALKYARFAVTDEIEIGGHAFVETPHGLVARASVRIARKIDRPDRVGPGEQWIHIDLDEQTLVAYEGDRPVRATLVSSGKPGYEPPLGLFRVHKKYTSKRMQGDDPIDGSYDIDQVPWTMYYWGSFVLPGAYWHDGFGHVRSHGCTNLPPADARWLFHWAEPALEPGWHAEVGLKGPWVYTTSA
jgi:hypothetical protein